MIHNDTSPNDTSDQKGVVIVDPNTLTVSIIIHMKDMQSISHGHWIGLLEAAKQVAKAYTNEKNPRESEN